MLKVGIDICSIDRIRAVYGKYGSRFLSKILTAAESDYVLSRKKHAIETLAGRFAAKEAVAKVLGVGWRGLSFKEIEIGRHPSGAPHVILYGRALILANRLNLRHFEVSLSHEKQFAVASVIGYSEQDR
jgi:holo-[acyl-carrier protein] synthase